MFTATVIQVFFDERFKRAPEVKQFCYGTFASHSEAELYAYQCIAFLYFELIAKAARFEPKLMEAVDNFNNLPVLKKALNDIKCHKYTYTASIVPANQPVVEITSKHASSLKTQLDEIAKHTRFNQFPSNLDPFFSVDGALATSSDDVAVARRRLNHYFL